MIFCSWNFVAQAQEDVKYTVPMESNTFITKGQLSSDRMRRHQPGAMPQRRSMTRVGREGLFFSSDTGSVAGTYIYFPKAGKPHISIEAKGKGVLAVRLGDKTKKLRIDADDWKEVEVMSAPVESGYAHIDFSCPEGGDKQYVLIRKLYLTGLSQEPLFIKEGFSSHFGRRGPSVHLQYALPKREKTEWFYNEVTVPADGDVIGSYYCAQGFSCGYFGIQNNSPRERRVLFSVWSPFQTQDPTQIPEEDRIVVLKKGENVHAGEFGNEGSGGQTYLKYNWKPGNTYGFLLHAQPDDKGNTVFTAYFYAPEEGRWMLIASLLRPKTQHHVFGSYSFVENFSPERGYISRKAYFGNAWAYTSDKKWTPVLHATVTNDDTGNNGIRVDYGGGVEDGRFFLRMGGFEGNGSVMERQLYVDGSPASPDIDFLKLPNN